MLKFFVAIAAFGVLLVTITPAALGQPQQEQPEYAEAPPDPADPPIPLDHVDSARLPDVSPKAAAAVEAGLASPYGLSAKEAPGRSWARAVAGYDGAADSFRVSSSTEAALTGRLTLRVDFEHGPSVSATDRVSFGMRMQILSQGSHGLDFGAGLFYQPNDFRREGNVVAALMLERRFNKVAVLGNAILGSDPEGDDQEIDGRLGTQIRISRLALFGVDSRFRSLLSTDAKRIGTNVVDWELAILPNAVLMIGPVVVIGQVGFAALRSTSSAGQPDEVRRLRTGVLLMSGAGVAF